MTGQLSWPEEHRPFWKDGWGKTTAEALFHGQSASHIKNIVNNNDDDEYNDDDNESSDYFIDVSIPGHTSQAMDALKMS